MFHLDIDKIVPLDAVRLQSNIEYGRRSDSWVYLLRQKRSLEKMRMLRRGDLAFDPKQYNNRTGWSYWSARS